MLSLIEPIVAQHSLKYCSQKKFDFYKTMQCIHLTEAFNSLDENCMIKIPLGGQGVGGGEKRSLLLF